MGIIIMKHGNGNWQCNRQSINTTITIIIIMIIKNHMAAKSDKSVAL